MRFLFVDKITSIEGDTVKGTKSFKVEDPLGYQHGQNGPRQIAPGVISEGIGQLGSWLVLKRNGFKQRPLFLFADKIAMSNPIFGGSTLELIAEVHHQDNDSCSFSGKAFVNGVEICSIDHCHCHLAPLETLEDPRVVKGRFNDLVGSGLLLDDDGESFDFDSLIDEVKEMVAGLTILTQKKMKDKEGFYRDHFPRDPITPIVMINEIIGQSARQLIGAGRDEFSLKELKDIKIKNFVRPGDQCETRVRIENTRTLENGMKEFETTAEVVKNGKRIVRGEYTFLQGGNSHVQA